MSDIRPLAQEEDGEGRGLWWTTSMTEFRARLWGWQGEARTRRGFMAGGAGQAVWWGGGTGISSGT